MKLISCLCSVAAGVLVSQPVIAEPIHNNVDNGVFTGQVGRFFPNRPTIKDIIEKRPVKTFIEKLIQDEEEITSRVIEKNFNGESGWPWTYTVTGSIETPTMAVPWESRNDVYVWRGIPYAADTGPRSTPEGMKSGRWRAPEPFEATSTTNPTTGQPYGTEYADICAQFNSAFAYTNGFESDIPQNILSREIIGSENCLALDIYTPADVSSDGAPVLFWIHGGANIAGASRDYNGTNLAAKEGVVVVSVQYRVGPLGYFAWPELHNSDNAQGTYPANFAIMDLIAALKWVQENVHTFGGDPNNVTIFGESAGGTNVSALLAATVPSESGNEPPELISGLYHKAISMSGSQRSDTLRTATGLEDGECVGSDRARYNLTACDVIADLEERALEETGTPLSDPRLIPVENVFAAYEDYEGPFLNTPVVIEDGYTLPQISLQETFLDPEKYNTVPMIVGTTRDETKLFMAGEAGLRNGFDVDCIGQLTICLLNETEYDNFTAYGSRLTQITAVEEFAENIYQSSGHEDIFLYRFDWDEQGRSDLLGGIGDLLPYPLDLSKRLGAAHAMDIPFIFSDFRYFTVILQPVLYPVLKRPSRLELSNTMTSFWGNFVRGERTDDGAIPSDSNGVPWERFKSSATGNAQQILFDTETTWGVRMSSIPDSHPDPALPAPIFAADIDELLSMLANEHQPSAPRLCDLEEDLITIAPWYKPQIEEALSAQGCEH